MAYEVMGEWEDMDSDWSHLGEPWMSSEAMEAQEREVQRLTRLGWVFTETDNQPLGLYR